MTLEEARRHFSNRRVEMTLEEARRRVEVDEQYPSTVKLSGSKKAEMEEFMYMFAAGVSSSVSIPTKVLISDTLTHTLSAL